jgi:hypothetical protein
MRISEDRYSRDLRRLNLAQRLIRHEVRTQWIRAWTGFSERRVLSLFRAYEKTQGSVRRHRGPAPFKATALLRSLTLRKEASAIGALARVLDVVPGKRRDRGGLEMGEGLCQVFEFYRQLVPQSQFTMDQFIRLVMALADADELEIGHCGVCHGALLLDRLGADRRICPTCREDSTGRGSSQKSSTPVDDSAAVPAEVTEPVEAYQQPLF